MSTRLKTYFDHGDYTTVNSNSVHVPAVETFDEVKGRPTGTLKLVKKHLSSDPAQQEAFLKLCALITRKMYFSMLEHVQNFEVGRYSDADEDEEGNRQMTIDDAIKDAALQAGVDLHEVEQLAGAANPEELLLIQEMNEAGGTSKRKRSKATVEE